MHFHSLAVIQIPKTEVIHVWEEQHAEKVKQLEQLIDTVPGNLVAQIELRHFQSLNNSFAILVEQEIDLLMHPYGSESEDCYEFCDHTVEVQKRFSEEKTDAISLPGGKLVDRYDHRVWGKYKIIDGKVYEQKVGKLELPKRSHKAKKMKAVLDCSFRKIYKTMHEFATEYCCYDFDEEMQGYGYYCNPNAMWDWYQIGGRWPVTFLVKEDCEEYAYGERSWDNSDEEYPAPEGYKWVSAARKKDIQWETMLQWHLQAVKKQFAVLESMFVTHTAEPESYMRVQDGFVYSFYTKLYQIGESEESYLRRHGFAPECKYYVSFCDLINEETWISEGDVRIRLEGNEEHMLSWSETIESFIEDLDDEDVLVSVDYHM